MLSIVAIGRNEAANIPRLIASIEALKNYVDFPVETIYIDSASTDNSLELVRSLFDVVVELEPSPHLCASAGRFAGTLEAHHPWVFYIDADMEICSEFFHVLRDIEKLEPEYSGVIGLYIHRFDNGSMAVQTFARKAPHRAGASQFGGAVVLRRMAVIRAGNWDPSLYGREEMELYVRLGDGKPVVRFVNIPMVYHYSEYYSKVELVTRLLMPSAGLGKVFWGYGQAVRALSIKRKLGALLRLDYEVYAFWTALLVAILLAIFFSSGAALALIAAIMVVFSLWLRPGSIIRYLTLPLSLIPGWFKYFPWFRPRMMKWGSSEHTAS